MKRKVVSLANEYSKILEAIKNVEAVVLGETVDIETFDPYFIIEFDVFYHDQITPSADRKILFGNPGAFETSPVYPIDRFLVNGLPVIIYYRNVQSINGLFDRIENQQWVFRREAAQTLYRIQNGQVQYNKSDWFDSIKQRLAQIDDFFWENILNSSRFLVENSLMELGVSIIKNNSLLFQSALSSFIQNVSGFIFALNRTFTPPARLLSGQIKNLKVLPDEFLNRFESICRFENEYAHERKVEIAKLIVKSLLTLKLS